MIKKVVNNTYEKLVNAVRDSYKSPSCTVKELKWCSESKAKIECNEINLWTYWQGKNKENTRILLVGQDWGCVDEEIAAPCIRNIKSMQKKTDVQYLDGVNKLFPTDRNLCELFKVFSEYRDIEHTSYPDLFFTNFALGYRTSGISGGEKRAWFEKDRQYFYDLVMLLKPKVIICLGKIVYEEVLSTFQEKKVRYKNKDYWNMLETEKNNQQISSVDMNYTGRVFGVAHCGGMGMANRKRHSQYKDKTGKDLQREDWEKIRDYMMKEEI